ncbi:hypothetical protein [Tuberibacillus sp. Marseille-P3662]|uniref:hypothetical protein n=1 Tax=Tuberibacillus sp. Marseille-P3662 TaxID=1965358 RepID=UPI0020CB4742|nr:hypothetical protein [Tuberibacillus sp. Marseille-P3662]
MHNSNPMNPQQMQGAYHHKGDDDIHTLCRKYMFYHVMAQSSDGSQFDGVITGMDEEGVSMLVPEWVDEETTSRQFGYGGGYGRRRYRRFYQRRFPYFFFGFPFFTPYPYYYPYPYY